MGFNEGLLVATRARQSLLCVGLDSDLERLPPHLLREFGERAVLEFNRWIIEATKDLVCAYKLNLAFYEQLGPTGLGMLEETLASIPEGVLKIADAKRGDISSTAKAYAKAIFDYYGFDAATVNPYLGLEALEPFLSYSDRGAFVLCRTSNPGAREFQDLECDGRPLYLWVAEAVARASERFGNLGLVVGATWPEELRRVRELVGDGLPILIPGVGAQAGDLERAVRYGTNSRGELAIINVSRAVIFASAREDFAQAARAAAQRLRDEIERSRPRRS
ncbi:MAG: orotidine-5'-phosphate decarboxylase [Candidatus Acetothermia bacterium]|jgi:orotidine-5'-phosphate decarboxylase|nr:orotidine-5'-phosphate decarboxylase [Candidatus Acetothermia bacterium]MDH7506140.1 orotidine-5'-phosphate decarboxylase [Candidatus Acetothermia bacterium]